MPDMGSMDEGGGAAKGPGLTRVVMARVKPFARYWPWAAGALAVLIGAWFFWGRGGPAEPYRTTEVGRGAITRVVSATGALAPLVSVDVGSTVSGLVETVEADFNSQVRAGQVLARLEPDTFQQRVTQAQASLSQARAQYAVADADYQRYQRLNEAGFASEQLMVQQRAARASAAAVVQQARASLASAQVDLDRSVIRSPIDGVVVDRQVNVGQSVAASFQAPVLFVIAQDLSRLQANITVDEADIGDVREDLPVRFTVDAFPDSEFDGRVAQVRQQGVDNSGVVSYTVVVEADNPRRQLLPGMTANAEIIISQTENVLRLPNAALRFRPNDPELAARGQALVSQAGGGARGAAGSGSGQGGDRAGRGVARLAETLQLTEAQQADARAAYEAAQQSAGERPSRDASPAERRAYQRRLRDAAISAVEPSLSAEQRQMLEAMRNAPPGARAAASRQAVVWVLRNNKPEPVLVEIGEADDGFTALLGGDIEAGDEVITGGGPSAASGGSGGGPMGGPNMRIRGA